MMGSYHYGKNTVCEWIRNHFDEDATILDVGACDGNWRNRLPEYDNMDAIEAYEPNLNWLKGYRNVYHADMRGWEYDWYDLIIFGDVIEHMTVEEAQKVLEYAWPRCKDMIIAVPFLYQQGAIYGNPYEVHIQDDLTEVNFEQRYPGYEILCDTPYAYRYYHKPNKEVWPDGD